MKKAMLEDFTLTLKSGRKIKMSKEINYFLLEELSYEELLERKREQNNIRQSLDFFEPCSPNTF